eukprot:1149581-Pelagomonas_calceolata.AAC.2
MQSNGDMNSNSNCSSCLAGTALTRRIAISMEMWISRAAAAWGRQRMNGIVDTFTVGLTQTPGWSQA